MKKIKNQILLPILFSVLLGSVCGKLVYKIYSDNSKMVLNSQKIYLLESGEYEDYDKMRTNTTGFDYVYYNEKGKYKTIVGITSNKDNINKIKKLYDINTTINEYYLNDTKLSTNMIEYDQKLEKENNLNNINSIVKDMLKTYNETKNIKLVKIS